ncbi:hypothetical protein OPT61_g7269 [Boeremia exigua]|uniref:Uncharacterized protein n=1 Tax=Boeremia exigua TaxID=749465 RepID=A0ACC2I346_9PLEO|nr:hypothetical protein OPT61_g7269 [Boeremia exigua]
MGVRDWYKNLTPRTRIYIGVGMMAYAGFGLFASDRIEEYFGMTPTERDYEEVRKLVPKITTVERASSPQKPRHKPTTNMSSIPNGNHAPSDTMRAVVWRGKAYHVSVENVPKPQLQSSEDAIIRLTSSALCGTELHVYRGFAGSSNPPWIMGHEGVGIVEAVGEAVQNVKPGDRVIVPGTVDDGVLNINEIIPALEFAGLGADFGTNDGLQAEYYRVTQADVTLIPIPHYPSRELDYLMISDIWCTAWTCLDISGFQAGETVAVFGAGPVGLLCAYSAMFRGAARRASTAAATAAAMSASTRSCSRSPTTSSATP